MDYGEFKSTMKDLQGRSREEIENMVQGITSEGTEAWGRTVVKLVENGQPLYQNATGDQLASIPATTLSQNFQASVIRDTLKYVQNGLSLDEYKLQSSFDDIQLEGLTL